VRVLDLTRLLPGGYATLLLADLGAEVIKIEDTGAGDYVRSLGPRAGDIGILDLAVNRGKRSVAINLRDPRGRDLFLRLARTSHAIIEGFRPGVMARLDLAYRTVAAEVPGIVYCSLTGYGQDGPDRGRSGHDLTYLAHSGVLAETRGDGTPVIPAVPVADLAGGTTAALAVLAGLLRVRAGGEGCYIDVAMLDVLLSWAAPLLMAASSAVSDGPPLRWLTGGIVAYHTYRTQDGRDVAIAALEPKFWHAFCEAVDHRDLLRAQMTPARDDNPAYRAVAALFASRDVASWEELARLADVPMAAVRHPAEVESDAHVRARGALAPLPGGPVPFTVTTPLVIDGSRAPADGQAPRQGEHTARYLRALGYSGEEIAALAQAGAVMVAGTR
jgi:alpha-methylacyl-CoA racemase